MTQDTAASSAALLLEDSLQVSPPGRWRVRLAWLLIIIIYLAGVSARWRPTADGALYLSLGRSIARGEGYVANGVPHATVTPGLPLVLAALRPTFDAGYWAPNLFVALCGLASLFLTYAAFLHLTGRALAMAVTLTTAASFPFYAVSHTILTDAPFVLLASALLYACVRAIRGSSLWLLPATAATVLAVSVRAPGVLIIGSLALALLLVPARPVPRLRDRARLCGFLVLGITLLTSGCFLLVAWPRAGGGPPGYVAGPLYLWSRGARDRFLATLDFLAGLPEDFARLFLGQNGPDFLAFLLIALVALGIVALWKRPERFLALFPLLAILAHVPFGPENRSVRHLIGILPALAYVALVGLCLSVRWLLHAARRAPPTPSALSKAVTVCVAVFVLFNAPQLVREAYYASVVSYSPRFYQTFRRGGFADLFAVTDLLRDSSARNLSLAAPPGDVMYFHYLTDRRVVPLPDPARDPLSADDADRLLASLLSRPDLAHFVLDVRPPKKAEEKGDGILFEPRPVPLRARLDSLVQQGALRVIFDGKQYRAYARPHPE
ncbi:MAG: glycosyltransferase family 39 protein [Planctomycetota bacterium]